MTDRLRTPGAPHPDLTFEDLEFWLQAALTEKDGTITLMAPELARIVRSHMRASQGYSDVRAAARREIIRIQNQRPD